MRRAATLILLCLALSCRRPAAQDSDALLADAKAKLDARDRKLSAYHLVTTVTEVGQQAEFEFFYRAPNKMLGVITRPTSVKYAFDGEKVYQQTDANKQFGAMTLKKDEQAALLLNQMFSPFAPEGFRAPLLVKAGARATRTKHEKAADALRIDEEAKDGDTLVKVSFTYRWPSMDFLQKDSQSGNDQSSVRVEDELCDEKLQLCVPKRLSQWTNGKRSGESVLGTIELSRSLDNDAFTLTAPPGFQKLER